MDFNLTSEQEDFRYFVHDFVAKELKPYAREIDAKAEFFWPAVQKMGPIGLLGLNVPEAYGGAAVDTISASIAIEEIAWGCGSTALAISAHNGLGLTPIVKFGTEAQKQRWLPQLATGRGKLSSLGQTEPGAGSDLKGGVRLWARKEGDEWVLNGTKMWLTNASIADLMIILARTDSTSMSHILVPTDTPGVHIGPNEKKMGLKGSPTNAVTFDDARVPLENLLGVEGRGLQQTLEVLDAGRISIGALAVGLAQAAFEEALQYAQEREAFGGPIAQFQAIQWMLADAATEIQAARMMVYWAAWMKDQGQPFTKAAAMAKLFATEVSERVCRNAIQIHGGYGYSSEFEVERMYRDTRLMTIGEGTSEIQRMIIARHILGR
ncbi:MAG: acyl-CoA dehydrogenase family protein [Anaerolineae bacterium]|nr:acyl-CoA dehydrogenase family protein [Anaerolineae bacterium]